MARKLTAGRAAHLRTVARIERRLLPLLRAGLKRLGQLVAPAEWPSAAAVHQPPASVAERLAQLLTVLGEDLVRRLVSEAMTEALFRPQTERMAFARLRTGTPIVLYEQTSPDELAQLRIGALIRELEAEGLAAVRLQLALIADAGITPEVIAALGQATGLTTRQVAQVERARRHALNQGASDAAAARTAGAVRARLLDVRARTIARTETVRYVGDLVQARGEAVQAAGGSVSRQWVSARDAHVDAGSPIGPCKINDNGTRVGLAEPFPSGHDRPPAHPNCRCVLELWVEEP